MLGVLRWLVQGAPGINPGSPWVYNLSSTGQAAWPLRFQHDNLETVLAAYANVSGMRVQTFARSMFVAIDYRRSDSARHAPRDSKSGTQWAGDDPISVPTRLAATARSWGPGMFAGGDLPMPAPLSGGVTLVRGISHSPRSCRADVLTPDFLRETVVQVCG